jgi:hypothetical protein
MNFAAPLAPAAQDFREMVVAEALRAAETAQHVNMRIAGDDLRLDVADPGLGAALLPAIRHHEIPAAADPTRLTVNVTRAARQSAGEADRRPSRSVQRAGERLMANLLHLERWRCVVVT